MRERELIFEDKIKFFLPQPLGFDTSASKVREKGKRCIRSSDGISKFTAGLMSVPGYGISLQTGCDSILYLNAKPALFRRKESK